MYRAITLFMREDVKNKNIDFDLLNQLIENVKVDFYFDTKTKSSKTLLNNQNVEDDIRSISVSENVSIVARIAKVRKKLIAIQQKIGESKNIVMDGRDIGTKVLPNAKLNYLLLLILKLEHKEDLLNLKKQHSMSPSPKFLKI